MSAFFGMKLYGKQIVPCDGAGKGNAIVGLSALYGGIFQFDIVTVDIIKARTIFDIVPQGVLHGLYDLIPSYMWHLEFPAIQIQIMGEAHYLTGYEIEQAGAVIFPAIPHQYFQSHADTEKRLVLCSLQYCLTESVIADCCHTIACSTLTGKDNAIR